MIVKPSEMDFSHKKLFIVIAGVPGIGKTTLALSAPRPLLIDADKGVDRVEARYRKDTIVPDSYDGIFRELDSNDLSCYDTIVVDTGGAIFGLLKDKIIAENPKARQSDGTLSLKGYGIAKKMFGGFRDRLKKYGKHIVMVFHASETVVNEDLKLTGLRIRIEGASRDEVWDDVDIGGFVEMQGNKRTIGFSNCDRYYAKGTHGVHGTYEIPELKDGAKNAFLSDLISAVVKGMQDEAAEASDYDKVMTKGSAIIDKATSVNYCNSVIPILATYPAALTSKQELWNALSAKAAALGGRYDKASKRFVVDNAEPAE